MNAHTAPTVDIHRQEGGRQTTTVIHLLDLKTNAPVRPAARGFGPTRPMWGVCGAAEGKPAAAPSNPRLTIHRSQVWTPAADAEGACFFSWRRREEGDKRGRCFFSASPSSSRSDSERDQQRAKMHSTNLLLEEPIRMASILEPSKTVSPTPPFRFAVQFTRGVSEP
jgi:hypothetical protein